jgi:hypothetical protein
MPHASPEPRVLLACTEEAEEVLRRALYPLEAVLIPVHDIATAMREVECGIDLVVCTLLFDESRMLDLAARLARIQPHIPFVCCRILSDLPVHTLEAAFAAAGYVGAVATVDMPHTAHGAELARAEELLCGAVLGHLHDVGHASMS